ncbi:MAG: hypothetical protein HOQ45_15260 [Nocardioidaceae bacterium]|nr:hypothetical protein [Nocardioidaceae bacterium]
MRSLVEGSLVHTGLADGLDGHRKLDWDIWVQRGVGLGDEVPFTSAANPPEHMHALVFGVDRFGLIASPRGGTSIFYGRANPGRTMHVATDLSDEVARLVRHELVPALQAMDKRPVLTVPGGGMYGGDDRAVPATAVQEGWMLAPFVFDADGNVIAGAFKRYRQIGDQAVVWILPHDSPRPDLWLAAAMREWHELTPDRIPSPAAWRNRMEWQTPEEADVQKRLRQLERERSEWEKEYARRRQSLEAQALAAGSRADVGLRRLVTSKGEPLLGGVIEALTDLGFATVDEDARRASAGQPRAHDLTLEDPDHPGEPILVEVKGDSKGGGGALTQTQRHLLRYAKEHKGDTPARCWLVLNHFSDQDPSQRPPVLQGADTDVALFAQDGGLVIDSRMLFTLVRRVREGGISAGESRSILWRGRGRLTLAE